MNLLRWAESEHDWMRDRGFMDWQCYCGAEVTVEWSSFCSLLDTDETITPDGANASWWKLACHNGHVLLSAHELSDDDSADTFEAPTTAQIVERLGSPEDVAAWRTYEQPKPPWNTAGVAS